MNIDSNNKTDQIQTNKLVNKKIIIKKIKLFIFSFIFIQLCHLNKFIHFNIFVSCQSTASTQDTPQTKYEISSYFGSRELDFDIYGFAIASNYSSFYWSHGVDYDDKNKVYYIIKPNSHTISIQKISNTNDDETISPMTISLTSGYRDGHIRNSLFNAPTSIAFFRQNKYLTARARYKQIIVLKDGCTTTVGKECADTSLTANSQINLLRLAEYYDIPDQVMKNLPDKDSYLNEVLIVADTDNHCIRKIDLVTHIVTTIAGKCTVSGCKDGPIGTNLINSPTSLGVDEQGIIFFYDGGVDYIRMIDPVTTFVSTLLKGACREDIRFAPQSIKDNLMNKRVICYKNWLNINGTPLNHKYEENLLSICQQQQSLCSTTTTTKTTTNTDSTSSGN